jgi:hypothetical protein
MRNQQLLQCLMIVSTFLFPFSSQGQLQEISSTDVSQSFKTVEDEALKHPMAFPLLKVLTDEIGPRLTGSPPDSRAHSNLQAGANQSKRAAASFIHLSCRTSMRVVRNPCCRIGTVRQFR